jgi:hypothetical protein
MVPADQLLAHPENWRIHSIHQQNAMKGVLNKLGWLGRGCIVNINTNRVIDGHMRIGLAIDAGELVPVDYVDLTEEEERIALATIDPVGAMATVDYQAYQSLTTQIDMDELEAGVARAIAATLGPVREPEEGDEPPEPPRGESDGTGETDTGDFMFGYIKWAATKVDATGDEIEELTRLYNVYLADNDGESEGFVDWLIRPRSEA